MNSQMLQFALNNFKMLRFVFTFRTLLLCSRVVSREQYCPLRALTRQPKKTDKVPNAEEYINKDLCAVRMGGYYE